MADDITIYVNRTYAVTLRKGNPYAISHNLGGEPLWLRGAGLIQASAEDLVDQLVSEAHEKILDHKRYALRYA